MIPCNSFLKEQQSNMKTFLDSLAVSSDKMLMMWLIFRLLQSEKGEKAQVPVAAIGRDCASLYRVCVTNKDDLEKDAGNLVHHLPLQYCFA